MRIKSWIVLCTVVLLGACASMKGDSKQHQAASMIDYLYAGRDNPQPVQLAHVAELKVPLRIGIAFVPDAADPRFRITEADRVELMANVRQAFERYPFVEHIELVPSAYLQPGGGFENIDRVAKLLSLDCVALLSYDQMQFAGATGWSWLYWTGIGAYTVPADRYDVLTSIEAAIFDIHSRKLLLRAGGTSQVKGLATMVGFSEQAREARTKGFRDAVGKLIPSLHAELKSFRERAPGDSSIRLDLPPGYDPQAQRQTAASR